MTRRIHSVHTLDFGYLVTLATYLRISVGILENIEENYVVE